jgi:hypothetical protein
VSARSVSKCAGLLDVAAFLDISVQRGLADSCSLGYLSDAVLLAVVHLECQIYLILIFAWSPTFPSTCSCTL